MIILILSFLLQPYSLNVYAGNNTTYYAKILFEQVYFYRTPTEDNSTENIYFELPKTYFVELLSSHNNFYEARYLNIKGYVKKDSVQAVDGTPINPFLNNISFRVYAELSQHLRTSPNINQSNLITTIPNLTRNITYIGTINGETLIEGRTNVWYFCKYTADKDYYGYVYSDFCDELSPIIENSEEVKFISNPTFETPQPPQLTIPTTSNTVGIVVAILSVPAIIFILLLMRGTHLFKNEKLKSKEVVDY